RHSPRSCPTRRAADLALATPATGEAYNVGSGRSYSIVEVAQRMIEALNVGVEPVVTGKHRIGDIRHCFADIDKAQRMLHYHPGVQFEDGPVELANWLSGVNAHDNFMHAAAELQRRGLTL